MPRPHLFSPLLRGPSTPHRLVNRTRGLVLATTIEQAFESGSRRTGLLRHRALPHDTVLAIAPTNAIHTVGMKFPLDVLFVDREGIVLKRVLRLKAWRIAAAWRGFAVLEFGAGHPGVARTQVGDALELEPGTAAPSGTPSQG